MNIARYNGHCRRRRRRAPRGLVGGMQRGLSYLAFGGKSLGHGHGLAGRRGPAAGGRAVSPLSIDGRLGGPAAVTNWTAPDDALATTSLRRNERSTAKVTTTAPCRRRGASVWTTCPESLRSRALTRNKTGDLLVAESPTPYVSCTTKPPNHTLVQKIPPSCFRYKYNLFDLKPILVKFGRIMQKNSYNKIC